MNRKRAASHGGKCERFTVVTIWTINTITHRITDYITSLQVTRIGTRKIHLYRTKQLAGLVPTCSRVSCARLDQSQRNMCTSWLCRLTSVCILCKRMTYPAKTTVIKYRSRQQTLHRFIPFTAIGIF